MSQNYRLLNSILIKTHFSETEKKKITWKKSKSTPNQRRTTYVKVDGKWVKVNADGTLANETAKETAKPKTITTTTVVATTAKPTSASPTTTSATTRRRTASPSKTKKDANNKAIRRLKKEVKKEMDNFEEYSERVAKFMKTL